LSLHVTVPVGALAVPTLVSNTDTPKVPATPIFPLAGFGDTVVPSERSDDVNADDPELVACFASPEYVAVIAIGPAFAGVYVIVH
jgi:hypothetical protein